MKKDIDHITLGNNKTIKDAMQRMHENGIRSTLIVDENNKLEGMVTDGDVRRALLAQKGFETPVREIMITELITAKPETPAEELLEIMLSKNITQIPVVNDEFVVQGIILLSELKSVPLSSQDITAKEIETVRQVLNSQYLSIGPKIKEFEEAIANFVGVKYAIGVNSGTSGLHLAIRSLDIKDGDEVITTPFSFIASANCALFERAKPIFVDIDRKTLCIDPKKIEEKITKKTKAILPVDVFGHPADMDQINEIAKKYNLNVIEDSCEALGSEYKGKKAGSLCDVGVFAFYPNKQITTAEGGMVVTNDENIAKLCRSMRNQGRDEGDSWLMHTRLGYNYRMSELSAALGVSQIERIKEIISKRNNVANMYNNALRNVEGIEVPYLSPEIKMSWFVYVIKLTGENITKEKRDEIIIKLQKHGIACKNYFPPIHLEPFYVDMFGFKKGDFPVTEYVSERTIALPFYNNLEKKQIDYICDTLHNFVKSNS